MITFTTDVFTDESTDIPEEWSTVTPAHKVGARVVIDGHERKYAVSAAFVHGQMTDIENLTPAAARILAYELLASAERADALQAHADTTGEK